LEHNVGNSFPKREIPYDAAKVVDKKLEIKLISGVFFFWGGKWSFDPVKKSLLFECGCWIFDRNQELHRCQETKQKSVMHILRLFVFQSLRKIG
jgi:hypothetical protein